MTDSVLVWSDGVQIREARASKPKPAKKQIRSGYVKHSELPPNISMTKRRRIIAAKARQAEVRRARWLAALAAAHGTVESKPSRPISFDEVKPARPIDFDTPEWLWKSSENK